MDWLVAPKVLELFPCPLPPRPWLFHHDTSLFCRWRVRETGSFRVTTWTWPPGGQDQPASTTSPMPQHVTLRPTAPDTDTYPDASRLAPLHLLNTNALDRKGWPRLQPATSHPGWVTNAHFSWMARPNNIILRLWNEAREYYCGRLNLAVSWPKFKLARYVLTWLRG